MLLGGKHMWFHYPIWCNIFYNKAYIFLKRPGCISKEEGNRREGTEASSSLSWLNVAEDPSEGQKVTPCRGFLAL
jgi:hypothetical protein